jgi:outer membrane immunogenic protein
MMKRFLTGLAMLAASTALASAADLGVKPVIVPVTPTLVSAYTWSGLYVGAQVGYSWNADDWRNVPGGPNAEGWLAGGHVGYNMQFNMLVVGVEGSLAWSNASGSGRCGPGNIFRCGTDHNWTGDLRVRAGLAADRALFYVAGGIAADEVEASAKLLVCPGGSASKTETMVGYTIGGGAEFALTNNWILGAEYKYSDLGTMNFNGAKIDVVTHKAVVRASYKF